MKIAFDDLNDLIRDDCNCPHDSLHELILEEDLMAELLDTSSVTITVDGKEYTVSLLIEAAA